MRRVRDSTIWAAAVVVLAVLHAAGPRATAADPSRPNIVWITSEDNSAHWLGCYGNRQAQTPRIDRLADEGVLYLNACANAPVCAVARSTLLTGVYATTQGTQHMRSRYPIPERFRPYVSYLREAGYYCTNRSKTDYNFQGNDRAWWDECGRTAHYRNRPENAPFFAVFNITTSHESSLFSDRTNETSSGKGASPESRLAVEEVEVPPLYPDMPAVRRDIAEYHDTITRMDREVGQVLDELEAAGLADETIVFYYADHGGILPRSKRYLHQTGTQVPLVVRIPPQLRGAESLAAGSRVSDLVSFVDFAPTLLSLAGIDVPSHIQGRAFLGPGRRDDSSEPVFLFADRFDEAFRMHRAIYDGQYRYIHNFYPHLPAGAQNNYPYGIATWRVWRDQAQRGELPARFRKFWDTPQPTAELYHTAGDPWEVTNLASHAEHQSRLLAMREKLIEKIVETRDLGVIPEPLWSEVANDRPIYQYAREEGFPREEVVALAFQASDRQAENLPRFVALLSHKHPVIRYWGTVGCLELGDAARSATPQIRRLLDDDHSALRITAAHCLYRLEPAAELLDALAAEIDNDDNDPAATLAMHTLYQLGQTSHLTEGQLQRVVDRDGNEYATRWARRFLRAAQ